VKLEFNMSIEIRPRSLSGVIFSVHGSKGDFVILQLIEGEVSKLVYMLFKMLFPHQGSVTSDIFVVTWLAVDRAVGQLAVGLYAYSVTSLWSDFLFLISTHWNGNLHVCRCERNNVCARHLLIPIFPYITELCTLDNCRKLRAGVFLATLIDEALDDLIQDLVFKK